MSTVLDILTVGVVWLAVAFVAAVFVGRWLAAGSGQWLLDEWAADEDEGVDRAA